MNQQQDEIKDITRADAAYLWYVGQIEGDITAISLSEVAGVELPTAHRRLERLRRKEYLFVIQSKRSKFQTGYGRNPKAKPQV